MNKANHLISWLAIIVLMAFAYWGLADQKVSEDAIDTKAPEAFSVDNVVDHLKVIAKDIHFIGAPYHKEVRSYLMDELTALGLEPEIQRDRVFKFRESPGNTHGVFVQNVVAKIKGSGNGKSLLVMAHYDSAAPHSHGASDAGSGVATILEGIRVFLSRNETPKNDIIILFSDGEEASLMGARAFIEHHPLAKNVGLALNFEARGSGGPSYMLMENTGGNSKMLHGFIEANPQVPNGNSLVYSIYQVMPNVTESTPLREIAGINSFLFAFIDDFFDYHTIQDTWQRADRMSLIHQADYLMSSMNYFAFTDLDNIGEGDDQVFFSLPFTKLLHYSYNWNFPLLLIALGVFIWLLNQGVKKQKINFRSGLKSLRPFLLSLLVNCFVSAGLWQVLQLIHPGYKDILHGFPHNGYWYISAFMVLNIFLSFVLYRKWFDKYSGAELMMGPLFFWFLVSLLFALFLPGGAYLIVPTFCGLIVFAISMMTSWQPAAKLMVFTSLSLPLLYIMVPFLKMFPVTLTLLALPLATLFVIMIFGLLLPIFTTLNDVNHLRHATLIVTIGLFSIATANSGFSEDRRQPNQLRYFYNADTGRSCWGSWSRRSDSFLAQFFGEELQRGNIPAEIDESAHSFYRMYQETENRPLELCTVNVQSDSISEGKRFLEFEISPQRMINMISLIAKQHTEIERMTVNGTPVETIDYEGAAFDRDKGETILRYILTPGDQELKITVIMKDEPLKFSLQELSYDLLSNEHFNIRPRAKHMMPQIGSDAIKTIKSYAL